MLQLRKPFKLTPLVHLVRSLLRSIHHQVKQRQQQRCLNAAQSSLETAPFIEVAAVPVTVTETFPELPEPLPIPPSTYDSTIPETIAVPEPESLAVIPLISGDFEPFSQSVNRSAEGNTALRSRQVVELLEEADRLGLTTYPQLMDYVKSKTGTGCSRRTIANWKRARQQHQ